MRQITLGTTGIVTTQNAMGCLPIQRVTVPEAASILRRAYEGGITYFDTARAYSDSEIKLGEAFDGIRDKLIIATKTGAKTPEGFWKDLETSLTNLRTDHIDVYQLHCADRCYRPGDGTGMYEAMLEAKEQGKILHIGITAHKIGVAEEIATSGLYETLQFPFSYLAGDREKELVRLCGDNNVGFIAMKGLAGGLLTDSRLCMGFMSQYDNVLPIWGVQRMAELEEWLSYMDETPEMTEEIRSIIDRDRESLGKDFCRGCGYCAPCTVDIKINACARMSLMLRRAPSKSWLTEEWQAEMDKIDDCVECGACMTRCPYELNIPELLKKNLEDYRSVLRGETVVQ